jgi:hypothetical protein
MTNKILKLLAKDKIKDAAKLLERILKCSPLAIDLPC